MRFEYVDTDGHRDSELLYLKFKRDYVCTARKSAGVKSFVLCPRMTGVPGM